MVSEWIDENFDKLYKDSESNSLSPVKKKSSIRLGDQSDCKKREFKEMLLDQAE